mgnify:CR=1 FL=1
MSWDLAISTSPQQDRVRHQNMHMFRMTAAQPFDPGMFAWQARQAAGRSRARTLPTEATLYDEEKMGLVSGLRAERTEWRGALMVCAAVTLWLATLGVLTGLYWSMSSNIVAAQEAARPYFTEAINHTMSILQHVDGATVGADAVMHGAHDLTDAAVPALQLAINQSTAIIERLERLARNPVLQLSLANAPVLGR